MRSLVGELSGGGLARYLDSMLLLPLLSLWVGSAEMNSYSDE